MRVCLFEDRADNLEPLSLTRPVSALWCGMTSLADIIAWNEQHPDAIPYGHPLLIAAQATNGSRWRLTHWLR